MSKEEIQSILGAKTVSFNSLFAKATGSVTAAVLLSQAIFWQEKAKFKTDTLEFEGEQYFSKTGAEWFEETGLSVEQQKTARVPLVRAGILKEKRAGLPAKMYFRVDIEALVSGISGYLNQGRTVSGFSGYLKTENPRTGSGKFRKQVDGNSGNIINIESFESIEREGERLSSPFTKTDEIENCVSVFPIEAEKEKDPPNSGPPPLIVTTYTPQEPYVRVVEMIPPGPQTPGEKIRAMINAGNYRIKEVFSSRNKIPQARFDEYLDAFNLEQTALPVPTVHKSDNDLVSHFWNWAGIRWQVEQRAKQGGQQTQPGRGATIVRSGGDMAKYEEKQVF